MNEFEQRRARDRKILKWAAVVVGVLLVIAAFVNIVSTGDGNREITTRGSGVISTPGAMRTCTNSEAMAALREPSQKADRGEWTQSQAWAAAATNAQRMGCKLP